MTAARQARPRKARSSSTSWGLRLSAAAAAIAALVLLPQQVPAAAKAARPVKPVAGYGGLTGVQRANLLNIARDTWKFYGVDIDPATNLPMDNVTFAGGSATPTGYGKYTSAANIGVYLWAVVAARDLGLISEQRRAPGFRPP